MNSTPWPQKLRSGKRLTRKTHLLIAAFLSPKSCVVASATRKQPARCGRDTCAALVIRSIRGAAQVAVKGASQHRVQRMAGILPLNRLILPSDFIRQGGGFSPATANQFRSAEGKIMARNSNLEKLARSWREYAESHYCQNYNKGMADGLIKAANELEAHIKNNSMSERLRRTSGAGGRAPAPDGENQSESTNHG